MKLLAINYGKIFLHYNQRRHSIWRVFTVVINPLAEKFLKTCLPVCLRERVRGDNTIWFLKIFIRGFLIEASIIPEMRKVVNAANKFLQFSPTTMCWRTTLNVTQIYCLFYDTHKQNWWLTHDPNQLCHDNSSTEVTESQRFPSSLGVLGQAEGSDEGARGHRDTAPEHLGKKRSCNPHPHYLHHHHHNHHRILFITILTKFSMESARLSKAPT